MKIAGMLLVIAGCVGIGIYYQIREIFRYRNLQELLKAAVVLAGEIASMRTPLPDALFQASCRSGGVVSVFLRSVTEELEGGQGEFSIVWKKKLQENIQAMQLREQDRHELEELGTMLGYLDVEMQIQSLELYKKRVETSIEELESQKEKRSRLYPVLGTMAGVLLCILIV
jgi:stage III sporulation protein AB